MANVKITQLPSATTPLTGTEVFPLVQGTTTKQVAITGLFTSPVMTNPTLGTVGQADLINATGLPISTGVAGLGTGVATFLGTPSSTNLRAAVTDETGTGSLVFATSPTLVTPNLGTPSVLVATNATGTAVGLTAGSAITNANLTGAVTSVGNATSLGSFTSAQLRTALTDETGAGSAVFATSPTITAPILNQINDTNNAQILGLSPTTSAVDYFVVKNGIGVGVPLHFYADGSSANIGLHIQPKGSGLVTISDGTDFNKGIRFRSSSSAASAITLLDAVSTAGRVVTLPDATTTLVGRDTTDTLTNKTIAFSSNTFSGTLAIANGGTNASTAASAIENLLPAYVGNGSKGLRLNSGATALEWVADGGGTVTSVGGTGTVSGISLSGTVTTSGNLTLGGTLDLSAYNGAGAFTTLSASSTVTLSGGTANGVTYLNGSKVLTSGSALTFDGTNLGVGIASATSLLDVRDGVGSIFTLGNTGNFGLGEFSRIKWKEGSTQLADIGWEADTNELRINNRVAYTTFYASNAEALRLTSTSLYTASGINVGFGTSNPTRRLSVETTNTANQEITNIFANSLSNSNYVDVLLGKAATTDRTGIIRFQNGTGAGDSSLQLGLYGQSPLALTLTYAGNLGLGVTPSAWASPVQTALQLKGGASFASWGSFGGAYTVANAFYNGTNWKYLADNLAGLYVNENGVHAWSTAASGSAGNNISFTQAMTLDASGKLLLGTTSSPSQQAIIYRTSATTSNGALLLDGNGNYAGVQFASSGTLYGSLSVDTTTMYMTHGNSINFRTGSTANVGGTDRMVIDSSGNLLVGQTSTGLANSTSYSFELDGQGIRNNHGSGTPSGYAYMQFGLAGTSIGSITQSGTTAVLYNVTSDQRLKENIQDADSASSLIDSLQVRKFDWKADGNHQRYGFIAQELLTVAPEAVHQPTDTEQMMAVDYSKLVPMLVKEIQSLRQRLSAANL